MRFRLHILVGQGFFLAYFQMLLFAFLIFLLLAALSKSEEF